MECIWGQNGHCTGEEAFGGSFLQPGRRLKPSFQARGVGYNSTATSQPPNQPPFQAREIQLISTVTFCGLAADVNRRLTPDMQNVIQWPRYNRRINLEMQNTIRRPGRRLKPPFMRHITKRGSKPDIWWPHINIPLSYFITLSPITILKT